MTPILKLVLLGVIVYFVYDYFRKITGSSSSRSSRKQDREVRIFKTKEVEKPKYNVNAETVDFEEIDENETK
ncbi:hypothetical protein EQP59_04255 [Ornithobacterium rhinotracheale]|uniref:Uncharacterized protein n=1 Tax=Ornithobacterium rhinotracheale TaxID=28251 RepID=A0A3R5UXA2_ORNRH|nr:hypothetical protein [Ornithobacterium rhinotracheale]QAR30618.1 hypothetical protein EQP59_04255 [Ornithobacterium rhinotracheale]